MEDSWIELAGASLPYHLNLDASPLAVCNRCGRQSWSENAAGTLDRMTQPDGLPCGGLLVGSNG